MQVGILDLHIPVHARSVHVNPVLHGRIEGYFAEVCGGTGQRNRHRLHMPEEIHEADFQQLTICLLIYARHSFTSFPSGQEAGRASSPPGSWKMFHTSVK